MHAAFAGPAVDVEAEMDLDAADAGDPAQVAEYAADIYAHFKSEELTKSAKHGYMASQSDINEKVRTGARRARARGNGLRGDGARCSTGAEWGTLQRPGASRRPSSPHPRSRSDPDRRHRLPVPPPSAAADARHPDREPTARRLMPTPARTPPESPYPYLLVVPLFPSSSRLQDWLVEVHLKFKLMPETLYLTVNIIGERRALHAPFAFDFLCAAPARPCAQHAPIACAIARARLRCLTSTLLSSRLCLRPPRPRPPSLPPAQTASWRRSSSCARSCSSWA